MYFYNIAHLPNCRELFGENGEKKLSYEQFAEFLHGLKVDMLRQEFSIFDPENTGSISMESFFKLISSKFFNPNSANMPHLEVRMQPFPAASGPPISDSISTNPRNLQNQLIRLRDRGFFKNTGGRVPFDTFLAFAELSRHAEDITQAIQMYTAGGRPLKRDDFVRAVQDVADVSIHPKEVDIVFALFDTKGDGVLDYDEFFKAISSYSGRGNGVRRYGDSPRVK